MLFIEKTVTTSLQICDLSTEKHYIVIVLIFVGAIKATTPCTQSKRWKSRSWFRRTWSLKPSPNAMPWPWTDPRFASTSFIASNRPTTSFWSWNTWLAATWNRFWASTGSLKSRWQSFTSLKSRWLFPIFIDTALFIEVRTRSLKDF